MKTSLLLTHIILFSALFNTHAQFIGSGLGNHSVVINGGGFAYAWGFNDAGQLGNENTSNVSTPIAVTTSDALSGKTLTKIASGGNHTIALGTDGKVYTWGKNNCGQLGNNSQTVSYVPVIVSAGAVPTDKTITQIAGGAFHSIALASDGKVYTWGANTLGPAPQFTGQLGNNNNNFVEKTPVAVYTAGALSGKTITRVAAGSFHSMALDSDGKVYTWGYNQIGLIGNGDNNTNAYNTPVAVATDNESSLKDKVVTQIAGGDRHCVALATDGRVYTWGNNLDGQLGDNGTNNVSKPTEVFTGAVLSGKTVTQIASGRDHCIALTSEGKVYTWGNNDYGQLGNGNTGTDRNVPVLVGGLLNGKTIIQIGAGTYHCFALASDYTMYSWGRNNYGQLGNGNSGTDSNIPVLVDQSLLGPLPVQMSVFKAEVKGLSTILLWETATEMMNYGFEIERRSGETEADSWETIGFVSGFGNSNAPKYYSYTDQTVSKGKYYYRLKQLDTDGKHEYSEVIQVNIGFPASFVLNQNYPNPFNPSTVISFGLPEQTDVTLTVFNALGEMVHTITKGVFDAGSHSMTFSAEQLPSGVYFYRLQAGYFVSTQKMILMR